MANCTCHALRSSHNIGNLLVFSFNFTSRRIRNCNFSLRNCMVTPNESRKLVLEVKKKLEKEYNSLPVGKNGRDDEEMILWFLKDRKFSVEEAVAKLTKAIKWRKEFNVSELSEESVKKMAETGKSYLHEFLDVNDRPVLIVDASKHFPSVHDPVEDEILCVFLVEKALSLLPAGKESILIIVDLRGFGMQNADTKFITFLVRFCSAEDVRREYFTEGTLPVIFRG